MGHLISDAPSDGLTGLPLTTSSSEELPASARLTSADIAVPSDAVELLRQCIVSRNDGRAGPLRGRIRAAVRPICSEAHRTEVVPEQFLIALKKLCRSLPEYERIRGPYERSAFLDVVVTVAIEEFYRSDSK